MDFLKIKFASEFDVAKQQAVLEWVIDEMQRDVMNDRGRLCCLMYGFAHLENSDDHLKGRITWSCKTGGMDFIKPLILLKMLENLRETVSKSSFNGTFQFFPWYSKLAWRILLAIPFPWPTR